MHTFSMFSLMAYLQALWHISVISAPLKPWVYFARALKSTSFEIGDFLKQDLKIWYRDSSSGRGIYINWSRRPGLRSAGSIISGLFVAPIIKTVFLAVIPSISVRSWFRTRSAAPPASPTLLPLYKNQIEAIIVTFFNSKVQISATLKHVLAKWMCHSIFSKLVKVTHSPVTSNMTHVWCWIKIMRKKNFPLHKVIGVTCMPSSILLK